VECSAGGECARLLPAEAMADPNVYDGGGARGDRRTRQKGKNVPCFRDEERARWKVVLYDSARGQGRAAAFIGNANPGRATDKGGAATKTIWEEGKVAGDLGGS